MKEYKVNNESTIKQNKKLIERGVKYINLREKKKKNDKIRMKLKMLYNEIASL